MNTARAFVAIELPETIKAELTRAQSLLRKGGERAVKWVGPEGLHITLKFLGNIEAERVAEIQSAMSAACLGMSPFTLCLSQLGVFPSYHRPRVLWVGLAGETGKLVRLQQGVDVVLLAQGFPREKNFTPHITLGRVRERATPGDRVGIGRLMAETKLEAGEAWEVKGISLMRSILRPEGALYSRLAFQGF